MKPLNHASEGKIGVANHSERKQWSYLHIANIFLTLGMVVSLGFLFVFVRDRVRLKDKVVETGRDLRDLRADIRKYSDSLSGPPSAQVSDLVPPFAALDLTGKKISLDYQGSEKYLLFFFSPLCSVCVDEFEHWNKLTKVAKANGYTVFGISLTDAEVTKQNLPKAGLQFQVLIMPNMALQRAYRVLVEPVVMVVSPPGVIDWVRYGALSQSDESQLAALLSAKKPS